MVDDKQQRQFRIKVGHAEIIVSARDQAEAVRLARKKLGIDMPRLWDVIYSRHETEFEVEEIK